MLSQTYLYVGYQLIHWRSTFEELVPTLETALRTGYAPGALQRGLQRDDALHREVLVRRRLEPALARHRAAQGARREVQAGPGPELARHLAAGRAEPTR